MKNIKLVATDMDHTLLTDQNELPPNLFADIEKLQELGVEFAIASGRPVYTLEDTFGKIKDKMTFISDNGGVIVHHGEVIQKSLLLTSEYQKMVRFTLEQTDGVPVICALDAAYIRNSDRKYEEVLSQFYTKMNFVENLQEVSVDTDKFTIFFPEKDSIEQNEQVFTPEFGNHYSVTVSGVEWIDIMNQGINKGTAMAVLGEKLNIQPEEMMAFGDMFNDAEMLNYVGFGYLVANFAPGMERYAKYRTFSNNEYGVSKVLTELIAAKESQN